MNTKDLEDDDLDDLDDVLDAFDIKTKNERTGPVPETEKSGSEFNLDEDFSRQLQLGMSDLLKQLDTDKELQQQFESIVKELGDTTASAPTKVTDQMPQSSLKAAVLPGSSLQPAAGEHGFGDAISRTMERIRASERQLDDHAALDTAGQGGDDFLEDMLRQLQSAAGEGSGEEDFSQMLLNMMEQLTNKEILYEPMKDLNDKFPGWLVQHGKSECDEDIRRYQEQHELVSEIVAKFESSSYSDDNTLDRTYIVERMQKMQTLGNPPKELMGDLGNLEGLEGDAGCPVQ